MADPRLEREHRPMSDIKKVTRCPACTSDDIVSIEMDMEGVGVHFQACHKCENRWWERDGERIPLESILSLVPRR